MKKIASPAGIFARLWSAVACAKRTLRRRWGKPFGLATAALFLLAGSAFPETTGDGTLTGSFEQRQFTLTLTGPQTLTYEVSSVGNKAVSLHWEFNAPQGSTSTATITSGTFGWLAGTEGELVSEQVNFDALAGNTIKFTLTGVPGATLNVTAITMRSLPPSLTSLSPTSGSRTGGYNVTLSGSGFDADQEVWFGTTKATIVSFSETSIVATVPPANAPGDVSVVVKSGARASNSLTFTYKGLGPTAILTNGNSYTLPVNQTAAPFTPVKQDSTRPVDGTLVYSSSGLPAGLSLNAQTGAISGTPTMLGSSTVTITIKNGTDSNALSSSQNFTLTIGKATANVTLAASTLKPKYNEAVKLTVTVAGPTGGPTPSGTVDIMDGSTKLGSPTLNAGKAELTVPAPLKSGTHVFQAVWAGDANYVAASSSTVTVTAGRPDPTKDKNVGALIAAQVAATQRFALTQIDAVQRRMETLHSEDVPAFVNGLSASQPGDMGRGSLYEDPVRQDGLRLRPSLDRAAPSKPANPYGALPETNFNVWTSGAVIFGGVNVSSLGVETKTHFTLSGVTAGVDTMLMDDVKGGFAVSYSGETTDIGTDGTRLNSRSMIGSAYASWQALPKIFVDGMLGFGGVNFDARRYDANAASLIRGDRRGRMLLGSLALSYDEKAGPLSFAPFARLDALAASLGAYQEQGDANWTLAYRKSALSSQVVVLGMRSEYAVPQTWGVLSPTARLEYRRVLNGEVTQTLSYANEPETTYALTATGSERNLVSTSLGLKAQGDKAVTGALEYTLGGGFRTGVQGQGVKGSLRVGF